MNPAQLIAEHGPLVWSLCRRLDPSPEDAYQEIWEKALGASFDPAGPARYSTWLSTLAHRHLVDRFRRRRVRAAEELVDEPADDHPQPDEALRLQTDLVRLERALANLGEDHRRVVVLHHLHGLPLDTIAANEGLPVGTIKSRLHRARAQLVEQLA